MMYNINNNKSNKYFILSNLIKTIKTIKYNINSNITNILLSLLILISSISINNNTYAKAKLTDTVSILKSSSFDKECIKKCENDPIEVDVKEIGFFEFAVSGKGVSYILNGKESIACNYTSYSIINKREKFKDENVVVKYGRCRFSPHKECISDIVLNPTNKDLVLLRGQIHSNCNYNMKNWGYDVKCVLGGFYNNLVLFDDIPPSYFNFDTGKFAFNNKDILITGSNSNELQNSIKQNKDKMCRNTRNLCKASCSKYNMFIGNKEIKTVGDLLDSIPATELLKVYDPNMVN